jgi:hypothetical protein
MATQRKAAEPAPAFRAEDECGNCGGVECGTGRVPVCCGDCTH